jgi:hypothetical protein
MKTHTFQISMAFILLLIGTACSKSEEKTQFDLLQNEFLVQPSHPKAADEVQIITYDCRYNQFAYINKSGFDIEVVKHFNSMMKWACILDYDTISLGKLAPGTYQLTLTLVDISTAALSDSISHQETQSLVVKR